MYYVTMTDTFMSDWGQSRGKKNKLVFKCKTYAEAEIVAENAEARSDQVDIKICERIPDYDTSKYLVQVKDQYSYGGWYKEGFFSR